MRTFCLSLVGLLLFCLFLTINIYKGYFLEQGLSPSIMNKISFFSMLCLIASYIFSFALAVMSKIRLDEKAFLLMFIGLWFGVVLPKYLLPSLNIVENSMAYFYVDVVKDLALLSCAGAAGSLFATFAESHTAAKKIDYQHDGCKYLGSLQEVKVVSAKVSKLTKVLYISISVQALLVVIILFLTLS